MFLLAIQPPFRRPLAVGLILSFLLVAAGSQAQARDPIPDPPKLLKVRPTYDPGDLFRYRLQLSGQTAWTPAIDEADAGSMTTDFTFLLRAKTERPDGGWTFDLIGEQLRSTGESAKGKIDVSLDQRKTKVKARGKGRLSAKNSPLERPMTLTVGPRGEFRFGTGLLPLAVYMLPHVDHRFLAMLTTAPEDSVVPGDQWQDDVNLPVPGARGEPIRLQAKWKVIGQQRFGKVDVLAVGLAAQVDVKDLSLLQKNGDKMHIASGRITATGKALWDIQRGVLCSVVAEQNLALTADQPTRRVLRSHATCSLRLMSAQKGSSAE